VSKVTATQDTIKQHHKVIAALLKVI